MSDMNIYQRINAVMKEVEYVQKDTDVGGSYRAVSHDMVVAVLRKAMVEKGIVVRPVQLKGKYLQFRDKASGINQHLYLGVYQVDFVNVDNPEDYCRTVTEGHANDTGDKAPGKAMSYAVKYAMLKTFSLETGEDDEQRFSDPYTQEQLDVYNDLLDTEKAYEFYMFVNALPNETQTALYNSFPDGKKSAGKKKVSALTEAGRVAFLEMVEDVQTRLANHDISVLEVTDEMSQIEKRQLISRLATHEIKQLAKIKEASL